MRRHIDRLTCHGGRRRQRILRWRKKMKPFEDIIACLLGLTVGITVGTVLVTTHGGHSSFGSFHAHHASIIEGVPLASPVLWTRLARCSKIPRSPSFVA
jgi:hypothetical protein